jgi:hypothetical protein
MFCDACGARLEVNQGFCSQCGKEVKEGMHLAYPRASRVQEHVRLLGIFWMALSGLDIVGAVGLFIAVNVLFVHNQEMGHGGPPLFLRPLLSALAVFLLVKAVAGFAVGWGLLQREPWARVAALVLSFVGLFFNIPFGTALGVYTMWVLLPAQSEQDYDAQVRSFGLARS